MENGDRKRALKQYHQHKASHLGTAGLNEVNRGVDVLFGSFGILLTNFFHSKTFLNKVYNRGNFLYIFLKEHGF